MARTGDSVLVLAADGLAHERRGAGVETTRPPPLFPREDLSERPDTKPVEKTSLVQHWRVHHDEFARSIVTGPTPSLEWALFFVKAASTTLRSVKVKHSVGSREGLYSYHQTVFGASLRSLTVTAVALGATHDQFTDAARRVLDRIEAATKETRPNNGDGINALLAGLGSHECIDVEWNAHPSTTMDAGKVSTYNDVRLEAWQLACAEMEAARLAMQGLADAVTACEKDGTDGTDDRELRLEELRRAVVAAKKAMLRAFWAGWGSCIDAT